MISFSPETAYREAEARIAGWKLGEPLDLAIDGLATVPNSIVQLAELRKLRLTASSGDHYVGATVIAHLGPLARLVGLRSLDCGGTQISDLSPLAVLTGLQSLDCSGTSVSDLSPLAGLTNLQSLDCGGTRVSDLSPLAGLAGMQSLACRETQVSDLSPLTGLTGLQSIECWRTKISDLSPLADLAGLQSLSCGGTRILDLSPLAGLARLQSLDCRGTQVSNLSPLAGLVRLQNLDCSMTQVSNLSPLAGLQRLVCWGTPVSDLSPLAFLAHLHTLDCSGTRVLDLSPLAGLAGLQSLNCAGTRVSNLSPLAGLASLQSLDCGGTRVSDLSPLAGLASLQSLDCGETQVSDLSPLAGLAGMQSLACRLCRIKVYPEDFFDQPGLEEFVLYEGALGDVPAEVLSQEYSENCLPRLRAHLLDLEGGAEPLRDAKLLVLGNGRAGKTQLCRKLLGEPYDEGVASTHAIAIHPWTLRQTPDGAPARIHLWDFGGQDIYHSTHVLFLRGRAMFLIAWTPATEDADFYVHDGLTFRNHPLPYWISQVAEFAGEAVPLILAQTRADRLADRAPLPEAALERIAGFGVHFALDHSAKTDRGQHDLEEAIAEAYATIPQSLIGRTRAAVKRALEDLIAAGAERVMTLDAFRALCDASGGVADAELFLETLHNAGVVFHRQGYFRDELILDQAWAIAAIYAVFERERRVYGTLLGLGGRFTRQLLGQLLWDEDHSVAEQELFLSMMQACGVCFEFRGAQPDRGIEAEYAAPDLLPEGPSYGLWPAEKAERRQERRYAHLPAALIRNVISAIGRKAGLQGDYWRTGVSVYEARHKSGGVIESEVTDSPAGRLTIRTRDGASGEFLAALAALVEREEARLGLKPEVLQDAISESRAARDDAAPGAAKDETLSFVVPRAAGENWFFSYANESERAEGGPVEAFCNEIATRKCITIRRDVNELAYGAEIEPFMRELAAGDRIFVWLTDAYLRSPYCMFELHEIWRTSAEKGRAFDERVTVILGDARIRHETDLKKYRKFWRSQLRAGYDRFERADRPQDVIELLLSIQRYARITDAILTYIRSRVRYCDFEKMVNEELRDG